MSEPRGPGRFAPAAHSSGRTLPAAAPLAWVLAVLAPAALMLAPQARAGETPPVQGAAARAARATEAPPTQLIKAAQLRTLLEAQRGKVVVLNVWGTWCVPCLREIPDLVALDKELAPRGMALIGLGMDEPGMLAQQVEPFRKRYFPLFRTWLRDEPDMDTVVSVVDPAWNEILPTTYLIGRDGQVARRIQGRKSLEEFRALVLELL